MENLVTANLFSISGYWKDDHSEFSGAIVYEFDECPVGIDDDSIFYFGLDEENLKYCVEVGEDTALEFVITEYKKEGIIKTIAK